ncbi:MAG: c-type cytochrome [Gaiellaceae bacterium]
MRRGAFVILALLAALTPAVLTGCGGGSTVSPEPETVEGTIEQKTIPLDQGDAAAGEAIFTDTAQPSCGSCHTYDPAGTDADIGPKLDDSLADDDPESILESIVNPSATLTEGFTDLMPKDYGEKLDEQQLADLVAFLSQGS